VKVAAIAEAPPRRLEFLAGQVDAPADFDATGGDEIARAFAAD